MGYQKLSLKILVGIGILSIGIVTLNLKSGLTIHMLDVGQGDCFFMQTREHNYLIDGGSSSKLKTGTYQIIPFLKAKGVGELDYVFITHSDSDHISGILELLEQSKTSNGVFVRYLVLSTLAKNDITYEEVKLLAYEVGTEIMYMKEDDTMIDNKLAITCLHPATNFRTEDANASSLVLSVSYGVFDMLFTGDIEGNGEDQLLHLLRKYKELGILPQYEILKVAHHGSKKSSSKELLSIIDAEVGLLSCGLNNSYGHPHKELLDRLKMQKMSWENTIDTGELKIWTDGKKYRITRFKE